MNERKVTDTNDRLLHQQRGSVLWLTLNRPGKFNALDQSLVDKLRGSLQSAKSDDGVRVLVLTGSGSSFCSGADLDALGGSGGSDQTAIGFLHSAASLNSELRAFPKPVIAALNGLTCAGGLEVAMCCDLIVAAESVRIGDAHSNYSAFPGGGGACVLPRRLGLVRAKFLLFTGDLITASKMKDWGLINEVVPDNQLTAVVTDLADRIAEKSSTVLKYMKEIANRSESDDLATGLAAEQDVLLHQIESDDFREGMAAFKEKRKPVFKG